VLSKRDTEKKAVDFEELKRFFRERFGESPRLFSAPGRVNLIGEHTDYNEGFVLPIAVNRRTVVAAAFSRENRIRVYSLSLGESAEFDLNSRQEQTSQKWVSYVKGVAAMLIERGVPVSGADLAIASDVPIGSGMSSSAALEMSVGTALVALAGVQLDLIQLAMAAQQAEHVYVGAKVGLMDQLAAAFGMQGHALLIDCRSLQRTAIPLQIGDTAIVVCDTNVKHELASSAYNERRAQCERAVELLRKRLPEIKALRDVSVGDFERYGDELPEPIRKRCRHVVRENERTLKAANALRDADVINFGELMLESHRSLRDDYEVSCRELDVMVEIAMEQSGVFGARMTGGGFGGCTVNLVETNQVRRFCDGISKNYQQQTGIEAGIYVVEAADGVREEK
jgi:galactokinase